MAIDKPPQWGNLYQRQINFIGQSHLLPGMNLALQEAIFKTLGYACDPKGGVWPEQKLVDSVLAEIGKHADMPSDILNKGV